MIRRAATAVLRRLPRKTSSTPLAHDRFERVLKYAYAAGAGWFLTGRTIWLDAVRMHFFAAVSSALKRKVFAILNSLSKLTKERAAFMAASLFRNSITFTRKAISLALILGNLCS